MGKTCFFAVFIALLHYSVAEVPRKNGLDGHMKGSLGGTPQWAWEGFVTSWL